MRIERYCPLSSDNEVFGPVLSILNRYGVKHNLSKSEPDASFSVLTFKIYEDHPAWPELEPLIGSYILCIPKYVFTAKELSEAPWLTLRSDNANKIYTEDDADERTFRYIECNERILHQVQQAPYELRRPPKWNSGRHFYGSDGSAYTNLFTSDEGKRIFSEHFTGIDYLPVLKYRTETPLPDIWQLRFTNVLPDESLVQGCGEEEIICPHCGRRQYRIDQRYRLTLYEKYLQPDVDFYTTNSIFGEGFPNAMIVIPQRTYRTLIETGLSKKLIFEPIVLK